MLRRGRSHALVKRIVLLPPDRIMEPLTGSPVRPIDTTMIGAPTTTIARTAIDTDIEASEEPTDAVDSSDSEPTQSATDRSDDEDISTTGNAASSSLDTLSDLESSSTISEPSASNSDSFSSSEVPAATGVGSGSDDEVLDKDSSNGPLIGGIIAAIIVVLLLLVGGFLLYRRRAQNQRRESMAAQRAAPYAAKSEKSDSFVSPGRRDSDRSVLLYNPPAASGTGVSRNTVGTVSSRRTHTTITEDGEEEELDGASYHDAALAQPVPPYSLGVPSSQDQSSESVMRGMTPLKARPAPNQAQDDSVRLIQRNTGGFFDGKRASQHTGQLFPPVRNSSYGKAGVTMSDFGNGMVATPQQGPSHPPAAPNPQLSSYSDNLRSQTEYFRAGSGQAEQAAQNAAASSSSKPIPIAHSSEAPRYQGRQYFASPSAPAVPHLPKSAMKKPASTAAPSEALDYISYYSKPQTTAKTQPESALNYIESYSKGSSHVSQPESALNKIEAYSNSYTNTSGPSPSRSMPGTNSEVDTGTSSSAASGRTAPRSRR